LSPYKNSRQWFDAVSTCARVKKPAAVDCHATTAPNLAPEQHITQITPRPRQAFDKCRYQSVLRDICLTLAPWFLENVDAAQTNAITEAGGAPMPANALARAAAALAADLGLIIGGLMRAARCSSGIAQRAIAAQNAAQSRAAKSLGQQLANGPKRVEHVKAAGEAAEIGEHALIAAVDALGVTTRG
jgi:hypothetical protein